jgi:periplasmic divalent cation tolerance protein
MRVVLCNCPPDVAGEIAKAVVERRLAACVNAIPGVVSTYLWEGKLCVDEETTLLIKTRVELIDELCDALVELHPHDVPEVIALPILEGHKPYLDWVAEATMPRGTTTKV